jgi:uncharacterized membrane protein YkoI
MQTRFRHLATPLAIALLLAGGWREALADPSTPRVRMHADGKGESGRAERGQSLDAIVAQVEKRYNARVVRAETRQHQGRTIYVLRLLNAEGKVWTVQVDADSGAVL